MAVDMFLKIDGVEGESRDETHQKEIDILSWSWGVNQSTAASGAGGASAGKVSVHDFSFVHHVDKASPKLMSAACTGRHFPEATLAVRSSAPDFEQVTAQAAARKDFLIVKMTDVLVTSVSPGGSSGRDDSVMEAVSLTFSKMELQYTANDQVVVGSTC